MRKYFIKKNVKSYIVKGILISFNWFSEYICSQLVLHLISYFNDCTTVLLITIAFAMFLCTCIRLSFMLRALAILKCSRRILLLNNRYECCFSMYNINLKLIMNSLKQLKLSPLQLHSASSIQIPQSTNRYNSMLPSVYVSPLKLHLATKINLHGVSDSALFRKH